MQGYENSKTCFEMPWGVPTIWRTQFLRTLNFETFVDFEPISAQWVGVAISMKHWVYWRMRPQKFKLICWVNSNFKFILRNILKKKKKSSLKMIKQKNLARTCILISPFHSSFIWDRLFVIPPKELFQYYSSGLAKL